ncbi:hypothetical protein QL285_060103 [Trifolium repens]|nr:hypothetical protein QL285_060103 [Trifolium repens]
MQNDYVLHLKDQQMQIYELILEYVSKISSPDVNAVQNTVFSGFPFTGTEWKIKQKQEKQKTSSENKYNQHMHLPESSNLNPGILIKSNSNTIILSAILLHLPK